MSFTRDAPRRIEPAMTIALAARLEQIDELLRDGQRALVRPAAHDLRFRVANAPWPLGPGVMPARSGLLGRAIEPLLRAEDRDALDAEAA
jgi:hypothetical protein